MINFGVNKHIENVVRLIFGAFVNKEASMWKFDVIGGLSFWLAISPK